MGDEGGVKARGVVRFFNAEKGWGFVQREGEFADVFVHAKALKESGIFEGLKAGDVLDFEVMMDQKGPKAVGITVVTRT